VSWLHALTSIHLDMFMLLCFAIYISLAFTWFSTHIPSLDHYGLIFGVFKCIAVVCIKTYSNWLCIKSECVLYYCYLYLHMWCYFNFNCFVLAQLSHCCMFLLHVFVIYFLVTEMLHVIIDWIIFLKWNNFLCLDCMHLLWFT
jgi:hypothetical protein